MPSESISTPRGRSGAMLHRDQVNGRERGRRGARLAAITSGGAIPENADSRLAEPEGKTVGTLDEDFAIESLAGDIFLLGTSPGAFATSKRPRACGRRRRAPRLHPLLARRSARPLAPNCRRLPSLREGIALTTAPACRNPMRPRPGAAPPGSPTSAPASPARGLPPNQRRRRTFFDEAGGMQLVLHAPFGSRINRAWGLALRKRFCRTFNFELQAAATDNGIVISLSDQPRLPAGARL